MQKIHLSSILQNVFSSSSDGWVTVCVLQRLSGFEYDIVANYKQAYLTSEWNYEAKVLSLFYFLYSWRIMWTFEC